MTTIIKTPKNPIQIQRRRDPLQDVLDALAKLVEKRSRVGDVTSQIGFAWTPQGRTPFEGSRVPGHPGRHFADVRMALDEHRDADTKLRIAIDAYLDQVAPTKMRRPLVVSIPPAPPEVVASATEAMGHKAPPAVARKAYAPRKPEAKPDAGTLWSPTAASWLHDITRPLKPGADPMKLGGWMSRRFFLNSKDVYAANTAKKADTTLYVCATNGHALVCLPTPADAIWEPQPGMPQVPLWVPQEIRDSMAATLKRPLGASRFVRMSVQQLHDWAPTPLARTDNPEEDIEPGVILGVNVNRKLVRAATCFPKSAMLGIWSDTEVRMVRLFGDGGEAVVIMGLSDRNAGGPVLA